MLQVDKVLMLVKPKCVLEAVDFMKNCEQIFRNCKYLQSLKRILAFPTRGQISTVLMLQPFISDFFQMEDPVVVLNYLQ